jgi:phage terminase Nu1 subunit (DNA packaging protein)
MTGRQPVGEKRMTVAERKARSTAAKKLYPAGLNPGAEDRAREARARAVLMSLKARKLSGSLVDAEQVRNTWLSAMATVRAALLAVPSRLRQVAPHLSAADIASVDEEIRSALEGLAGGGDGQAETDEDAAAHSSA